MIRLFVFLLPSLGVGMTLAAPDRHEGAAGETGLAKTFTNSIGIDLVRIDPGTFVMGSPANEEGRFGDEGPQRKVRITKPFYLGKYPLTRGQFRGFVLATGYKTEAETDGKGGQGWDVTQRGWGQGPQFTWRDVGFAQTDEHPVVNVTWQDALAFLKWLSKKERRRYELPREAEWEYACRAGTTSPYYFGDVKNLADYVWYLGNSKHQGTDVVGRRKPNAWGLYDMNGNVFQWCQDCYADEYDPRADCDDPKGPTTGSRRALRGGAFDDESLRCRCAFRIGIDPVVRIYRYGFRVCFRP
jgi:formylglycine-generating enzyme required for sulfatase activity